MMVVDASVVIELLLQTPASPSLEDRLFGTPEDLHAPALLDVEVVQVLRRYSARGELSAARGRAAIDVLRAFPVTRHPHDGLLPRMWTLRANLTAYDAAYVALAEALHATLVTRDERLAKAPGSRAAIEVL
jgi:predicted nucleic acid-binding protein